MDLNPLERYRGQAGPMPMVDLEFRYETAGQPTWSVNRLLTLIGRSPVCKLRFDTPKVSGVHCGLLLTRHGLWAIDLRGRGGTRVDGEPIRAQPLESGNEISFGEFQIAVFYDEPPDLAAPDRLTDNASGAETSLSDIESPYLHDEPVPETAVARPEETGREDAEWHGSIFQIEPTAKALVVIPIADHCGFRYQQLHIEANKLQRMFETRAFEHLVMDLEQPELFWHRVDRRYDSPGSGRHQLWRKIGLLRPVSPHAGSVGEHEAHQALADFPESGRGAATRQGITPLRVAP